MRKYIRHILLSLFGKKFNVSWNRTNIDEQYNVLADRIIAHLDYE